jgi:hypothetical protein
MNLRVAGLGVFLLGSIALADDYDDRAKLSGKWQLESATSAEKAQVWLVEDKGASIHIVQSVGDQKIAEFECPLAQECKAKESGKSVTVTVYYNGPRLVEMETRGKETFKRRFGLGKKADTIEVEVIPVVPAGDTEMLVFKRAK